VKFVGVDELHAAFLDEKPDTCPLLGAAYRKSGHLAKNERDVGHPSFVREPEADP
jgi:hypothetical protein